MEMLGVILALRLCPQSLTFKGKVTNSLKFKEKTTELDTRSYKCLLLALVKLIHADPKLMLHVSAHAPAHAHAGAGFSSPLRQV